jgi:hypothetical protein
MEPTIEAIKANGLLPDIDTVHFDRGYDYPVIGQRLAAYYLHYVNIQPRKKPGGPARQPMRLGLRWIVEATNSWWSNYAATPTANYPPPRRALLRYDQLITGKLLAYRNRWSPPDRRSA